METLIQNATTVEEISKILKDFSESKSLGIFAGKASSKMATMVDVGNMKNWRQAARASSKGRLIYNQLLKDIKKGTEQGQRYREIVDQNTHLIKTLPYDTAQKVTRKASKLAIEGIRASDIAKQIIKDFPAGSKASAKLIARTEVSKSTTALTRARSEQIGSEWYVWRTSQDQRVRNAHKHMEGVLCKFSIDPHPEVLNKQPDEGAYGPGEIYNCRCYPEPIVDIDLVSWPAKVHANGQIVTMTKSKFLAFAGGKEKVEPKAPTPAPKKQPTWEEWKQAKEQIAKATEASQPIQNKVANIISTELPKLNVEQIKNIAHRLIGQTIASLDDFEERELNKKASHFYKTDKGKELEEVINDYSVSLYSQVNKTLRGIYQPKDYVVDSIDQLNKAFEMKDRPTLKQDVTIFRADGYTILGRLGFNEDPEVIASILDGYSPKDRERLKHRIKQTVVGNIAVEKGFWSTAVKAGVFKHKPVQIKVKLDHKTTKSIYINPISEFEDSEYELLIAPGSKLLIESVEVDDSRKINMTGVLIGHE